MASSKRRKASAFFRRRAIGEFALAVAHIAGARDLRAKVVVQIAGQMQRQMAEAVAVRIRLAPELLLAQRFRQRLHAGGEFLIGSAEAICNGG